LVRNNEEYHRSPNLHANPADNIHVSGNINPSLKQFLKYKTNIVLKDNTTVVTSGAGTA